MSAIIPFDGGQLPAYLKNPANLPNVNAEVVTAAAYPTMSIKGKQWTVVRDGQRTVLMKPDDPDETAQKIEVAVIRANTGAKVFYAKKYVEGDMSPPTCFSRDGKVPSSTIAEPVHKNCQLCPNNQWGSRITEDGKQARACADQVRLAIATPDKLDDPYLLRVPPASIKNFKDAVKLAKSRNIPYNALVYRLSFDKEAASPEILFKPIGLLDDAGYAKVCELYDDELVHAVVGLVDGPAEVVPPPPAAKPAVETDELDAALAARAAAPAPAPKAKPVAKPAPAPVQSDELESVLGDEPAAEPAPAPAPAPAKKTAAAAKPAPKPAAKVVEDDDLLGGLDDLLGGTDD